MNESEYKKREQNITANLFFTVMGLIFIIFSIIISPYTSYIKLFGIGMILIFIGLCINLAINKYYWEIKK